jgi:hypothetical protein
MARKIRPVRIAVTALGYLIGHAGVRAHERRRGLVRQFTHGGRFHCAGCNRDFRGHRAMNAHHMAVHAGRWSSAKARKAARAMGKETDRMRRHARGWLEAAGLRDPRGRLTEKARSRPQVRGMTTLREMRMLHRHDRDHDRAGRLGRRADRARGRDFHGKADAHERQAGSLRERWATRPAVRAVRPAPAARPAPGTRPAPARPARTPVR